MLSGPSKPAPSIDAGSYITPLERPGAESAHKRRKKGANRGNKRLQAKAQAFHFMGGPEAAAAERSSPSGAQHQKISSLSRPLHAVPHSSTVSGLTQTETRSAQPQPQLGTSKGDSDRPIGLLPQLSPPVQRPAQQMGHLPHSPTKAQRKSRHKEEHCHRSEGRRLLCDKTATNESHEQEQTESVPIAGVETRLNGAHEIDGSGSNEDGNTKSGSSGTTIAAIADGLVPGVNLIPPTLTLTGENMKTEAGVHVVKSDVAVTSAIEAGDAQNGDDISPDHGVRRHTQAPTIVTCCSCSAKGTAEASNSLRQSRCRCKCHSRPLSTSGKMDRGRALPAPRTRFFDLARQLPRASEGHSTKVNVIDERAIVHFLRACKQRGVMPQPSLMSIPYSNDSTRGSGDKIFSASLCIDLRGFSAADRHAHVLAAALATAPESVSMLRLPNNRLTESGALALLRALQRNRIETKTLTLPGVCAPIGRAQCGTPSSPPGVADESSLSLAAIDLSSDGASGSARLGRRMLLDGLLPLLGANIISMAGKKQDQKAKSLKKQRSRANPLPSKSQLPPLPLQELVLAGAAIGAVSLLQPLTGALRRRVPLLLHLDLSRCGISGNGAELLGKAFAPVQRQKDAEGDDDEHGPSPSGGLGATLRSLVLAWNEISGTGARKLLISLRRYARALQHLDLAWNAIGSSESDSKHRPAPMGAAHAGAAPAPQTKVRKQASALHTNSTVKALCSLLKPLSTQDGVGEATASVCSLLHVDLRGNSLDVHACEAVRRALLDNHTLMGIHLGAGNCGANAPVAVDGLGFVQPMFAHAAAQAAGSATLRMGLSLVGSSKQQDDLAQSTDNCWVCGGWQERRFEWRPPQGSFQCTDWGDSGSESGSESDSPVQVAAKQQPESSCGKVSRQTKHGDSGATRIPANTSKSLDPGNSAPKSGFLRVSARLVVEASRAQKRLQVAAAQKLRRKERRKNASQGRGRRYSQEGELLPLLPTRVCARFAFDGWRRRELMSMPSVESGFECWCTVPPGEQQFIFEGVFPEDGAIKPGQQPRWRALRPVSPSAAKRLSKRCGRESRGGSDVAAAPSTRWSPCDAQYDHEVRPLHRYRGAGVGGALASVLADAASSAVASARAGAVDDNGGALDALPALAHCVAFPPRGGSASGIVAWCCQPCHNSNNSGNVTQDEMEELRGFPRPKQPARPKAGKPRKPWKFSDSIFAKFKDDTEDVLNRAFEYDWGQCGLAKMIEKRIAKRSGKKGPGSSAGQSQLSPGVLAVKQALRKLYPVIKDAFRHYATYSNEVHTMAWNAFTDFTVACGVTDGAGGVSGHRCDRAATDMIFMSCCTAGPRARYNPKRSLVRWQFMETVARIALEKYGEEHGEAALDKHAEDGANLELRAVEHMLHSDVEPNAERDSGSTWRHFRLWNEECDAEFRARELQLQKLFDKYKGAQQQTIGKATKLSLDEWRMLCEQVGALDDSFTERELRLCFVYSAQTRTDEFTKTRHVDREFIEFVECVARFAEVKDLRRSFPEVRHGPFEGPLHLKIKAALDMLLRPLKKGFVPLSIKNRKRSVDQTTNTSSASNSKRKASVAAAKVMNALRLSHAAD